MAGPRVLQLLFLLLAALVAAARAESPGDPQVGVLQELKVSDKDVQEMKDYALGVYNQDSDNLHLPKAVRIVRARKQVDYGLNYFLDIEIIRTTCYHSDDIVLEQCSLNTDTHFPMKALCSFEFFISPSQNTMSIKEYSCEPIQSPA